MKVSIVGNRNVSESPAALLAGKTGVQLTGIFASGEEALRQLPDRKPDVALVNFDLPCMDGFECAVKLKARLPRMPLLMFDLDSSKTGVENHEFIFPALHAGANGHLPLNLPGVLMKDAIEQVYRGMLCGRRVFLMFFDSDRELGNAAKHWNKIASILDTTAATISYESGSWRKVTLSGRPARPDEKALRRNPDADRRSLFHPAVQNGRRHAVDGAVTWLA